jgi:hypothetical protein
MRAPYTTDVMTRTKDERFWVASDAMAIADNFSVESRMLAARQGQPV